MEGEVGNLENRVRGIRQPLSGLGTSFMSRSAELVGCTHCIHDPPALEEGMPLGTVQYFQHPFSPSCGKICMIRSYHILYHKKWQHLVGEP